MVPTTCVGIGVGTLVRVARKSTNRGGQNRDAQSESHSRSKPSAAAKRLQGVDCRPQAVENDADNQKA
jgi:hypothetical protein